MAKLEYINLDLRIESLGRRRYRARILYSAGGEAKHDFSEPFPRLEIENFYLRIGRPIQGVRSFDAMELHAARVFGRDLFMRVFGPEINTCYQYCLADAQAQHKGLRLRLRFDNNDLAVLPWEYLFDPARNTFLSQSILTPIVRYIESPGETKDWTLHPPIKILVVITNPGGMPSLDPESEWQQIKQVLNPLVKREVVLVERLDSPTLNDLHRYLRRHEVHILHFIGFGQYDHDAQDGYLLFQDDLGRAHPVDGHSLGIVLQNHNTLRLVVLNAGEAGRASPQDPSSGAAKTLIQMGIPAVIAMQLQMNKETAITFTRSFYRAIAAGYPIDAALVEARTRIFSAHRDAGWGAAVYFTRAPHGQLFEFEPIIDIDDIIEDNRHGIESINENTTQTVDNQPSEQVSKHLDSPSQQGAWNKSSVFFILLGIIIVSLVLWAITPHYPGSDQSTQSTTADEAIGFVLTPSNTSIPTAITPTATKRKTPTTTPRPTASNPFNLKVSFAPSTEQDINELKSIWIAMAIDIVVDPNNPLQEYESSIAAGDHYRWPFTWCARTPELLQRDLEEFEIEFQIEEKTIPRTSIAEYQTHPKHWYCNNWSVTLSDWVKNSRMRLLIQINMSENVFDGDMIYKKGIYQYLLTLFVK